MFYGQRHEKVLIKNSEKISWYTCQNSCRHLANSDHFFYFEQLCTSEPSPKMWVLPRIFKHFCMIQKLADTAVKTAVGTSGNLILFLFPKTLYLREKSKNMSPSSNFQAFLYVSEISWYSCQNSCRHLTNPIIFDFLQLWTWYSTLKNESFLEVLSIFVCFRSWLIQLSKQLSTPHELRSYFDFLQLCSS